MINKETIQIKNPMKITKKMRIKCLKMKMKINLVIKNKEDNKDMKMKKNI